MSSEKIAEALAFYKKHFENFKIAIKQHLDDLVAISNEDVLAHCHWMVVSAEGFLAQGRREKAMRWLCFVQGCLFTLSHYYINEMKNHNRPDIVG
jgi:hypothetical protein